MLWNVIILLVIPLIPAASLYFLYYPIDQTGNPFPEMVPPTPISQAISELFMIGLLLFMVATGALEKQRTRENVGLALLVLASFVATTIILYAGFYTQYGLIGDTPTKAPSDCLYFSIVTWTTLGYGDIKPTPESRWIAASEAMMGYVFMGLYVTFLFQAVSFFATDLGAKTGSANPANPPH
jgi:uncharacterized membrane protein